MLNHTRRAPRSLRAHLTRATLRAVVVTLFPAVYLGAQAAMEAGYRAMGLA